MLTEYVGSLSGPNSNASEETLGVQNVQKVLKSVLANQDCSKSFFTFSWYLIDLSECIIAMDIGCFQSWDEAQFAQFLDNISEGPLIACDLLKNGSLASQALKEKGWNTFEIEKLKGVLIFKISSLMSPIMDNTPFQQWFEFLDQMKATRLFLSADVTRLLMARCQLTEGEEFSNVEIPFKGVMDFFWATKIEGKKECKIDFGLCKQKGNELAKSKMYLEALSFYDLITFLGVSHSHLLQSLSNSAAIRLRLSGEDPPQSQYAILECTIALQIDSNHVKALFRRGLALALCKKWNEAIVDFERAVELDPNSPAKKELEVARRQVTRRIGY